MQLKTVGDSLSVLNLINNISEIEQLTIQLENYSIDAIKAAISQSTLNKEQINATLYQKGLTGETLKTTTAELAQVTTNNDLTVSQKAATTSIL